MYLVVVVLLKPTCAPLFHCLSTVVCPWLLFPKRKLRYEYLDCVFGYKEKLKIKTTEKFWRGKNHLLWCKEVTLFCNLKVDSDLVPAPRIAVYPNEDATYRAGKKISHKPWPGRNEYWGQTNYLRERMGGSARNKAGRYKTIFQLDALFGNKVMNLWKNVRGK